MAGPASPKKHTPVNLTFNFIEWNWDKNAFSPFLGRWNAKLRQKLKKVKKIPQCVAEESVSPVEPPAVGWIVVSEWCWKDSDAAQPDYDEGGARWRFRSSSVRSARLFRPVHVIIAESPWMRAVGTVTSCFPLDDLSESWFKGKEREKKSEQVKKKKKKREWERERIVAWN